MQYSRSVIRGTGWNGALKLATMGLSFLRISILARLFTEYDFGLYSLVTIALGIMEATTQTGINITIIQSKKSAEYYVDTAWVIAIFRGVAMGLLILLLGFGMQRFYNEPQLLPLVALASFVPIIKGFINPAIVTMHKNLRFFQDALYRFAYTAVEMLTAIVLAVVFRSISVLIWAMLVSAVFEVIVSFAFFSLRPKFRYLKSRAQEIFQNARGLNISTILSYLIENVDNLLIGKLLGTAQLGIYDRGYAFTHKISLEVAKSVQHGTLPVYVRMTDDTSRFALAFWRVSTVSVLGICAVILPIFLFPDLAVRIVLGDRWLEVIPLVRPLLLAAVAQCFIALSSTLFSATKQYFWLNANLFVTCVALIPAVYFGSKMGVLSAVYGVLFARVVSLPVTYLGVKRTFSRKGRG